MDLEKTNKISRNSVFELLRVFSIFLIIFSHYSIHGIGELDYSTFGFNSIFFSCVRLGDIGTTLFMLISGFFLVNSSGVKLQKILKLLFELFFYLIVSYVISLSLKIQTFSFESFIKVFLGFFYGKNWFICCYILLYLLHPFINKMLVTITKKEIGIFIIILLFLWFLVPTFLFAPNQFSNLLSLFNIYCIGAFIRIAFDKNYYNKLFSVKYSLISLAVCLTVMFSSTVIFCFFASKDIVGSNIVTHFIERNSIFVLFTCISIFVLALHAKPFKSRLVNIVSSTSLGIYLIHDNESMRGYYWNNLFKVKDYLSSNLCILHFFVTCLIIFLGCCIIDLIRQYCVELPIFKLPFLKERTLYSVNSNDENQKTL